MTVQIENKTDEEIKEETLKRLYELSKNLEFVVPQLDEPNDEQKRWMKFRLTHGNTWPKVHENKIGDYKNWQ
jgi:hypothetical protein